MPGRMAERTDLQFPSGEPLSNSCRRRSTTSSWDIGNRDSACKTHTQSSLQHTQTQLSLQHTHTAVWCSLTITHFTTSTWDTETAPRQHTHSSQPQSHRNSLHHLLVGHREPRQRLQHTHSCHCNTHTQLSLQHTHSCHCNTHTAITATHKHSCYCNTHTHTHICHCNMHTAVRCSLTATHPTTTLWDTGCNTNTAVIATHTHSYHTGSCHQHSVCTITGSCHQHSVCNITGSCHQHSVCNTGSCHQQCLQYYRVMSPA